MKAVVRALLSRAGYELHTTQYWNALREWQKPVAPPGHFYSPYPDLNDILAHDAEIFDQRKPVPDVDLQEASQWERLQAIVPLYATVPFTEEPAAGRRYGYRNPNYSYGDAIVLCAMLQLLRPNRMIEIGCGYSTAATLDTNELFLDDRIALTCIEPYPDLLLSRLEPGDRDRIRLIQTDVQRLDPSTFDALAAGDLLFVDSTHVSRTDSDVNFLMFEVLPRLRSGVWIHFHDVFYPFEYPRHWVYGGRAWQEQYLVRVLLQSPSAYRIRYFHDMMAFTHRAFFERHLPLCLENRGSSLWIEKV